MRDRGICRCRNFLPLATAGFLPLLLPCRLPGRGSTRPLLTAAELLKLPCCSAALLTARFAMLRTDHNVQCRVVLDKSTTHEFNKAAFLMLLFEMHFVPDLFVDKKGISVTRPGRTAGL